MNKQRIMKDLSAIDEAAIYEALGLELVQVLGLKIKRSNKRINTSWGDKSPEGLGRVISRIVNEHISVVH